MKLKHTEKSNMRTEYDFTHAKPNPYSKKLRKQISIRIDMDTLAYFKNQSERTGIAYQNLINLYLSDCAAHSKTINISWKQILVIAVNLAPGGRALPGFDAYNELSGRMDLNKKLLDGVNQINNGEIVSEEAMMKKLDKYIGE